MALAKDQGINRALGKSPVSGAALEFVILLYCGISPVIMPQVLHHHEVRENFSVFLLMG